MAQTGYDADLFTNQNECKKYICGICLGVMRNACDIGCNAGHNFCHDCLTELANNSMSYDQTVSCPLCKQSVPIRYKRPNKFVNRLINELSVKCENKCGKTHIVLGEYDTHLERLCPKKYSLCQYKCGYKGLTKYIDNHEISCRLKEFMSKDISIFVNQYHANFTIASNIKNYFKNIYGENIIVMVGDIGRLGGYVATYIAPYKRRVQCQGKDILILYCTVDSNHTRGKIMDQAVFTSFCKGIIMDNDSDIQKIKAILSDVLDGKYLVTKDAQYEIASSYYCRHYCNVTINNHSYTCLRIG